MASIRSRAWGRWQMFAVSRQWKNSLPMRWSRAHGSPLGGQRTGNRGYFFPLTVLADVPDRARVMTEEPFGPLALIKRVSSLEDAIEQANSLSFGLAAYAFTNSARYVSALTDNMECGNLSINHFTASFAETPFGGVKDSGYGREGGTEGLNCYTIAKHVSLKTDQ